jgi:AcrR family transcriptional regulator
MAERKRRLVREELIEAALGLIAREDYEQMTIERIAGAAGMSRRSFFRYFRSKEDLVVAFLGDVGRWLVDALAARPPREPHAVAVRHAFSGFVDSCGEHPGRVLRFTKIILADPSLRGHFLEKQSQWRAGLADQLARRAGKDVNLDMGPSLAAAAAMAAFDTALNWWAARDGADDLGDLFDKAFSQMSGAFKSM